MNEENVMQLKRKKGGKPAICNSMDKLGVHYPERNKPDKERQILHIITMCGI